MFAIEQIKVPTQEVRERLNEMVQFETSVTKCDKLVKCIGGIKADLDAYGLTVAKVQQLPNEIITFGERDIIDGVNIELMAESEEVNRIWNTDRNFCTMLCRKLFGNHTPRNWTTLDHKQRDAMVKEVLKDKDYEQIIVDYGNNIVDDLCEFVSKHEWYVDVTAGYYDNLGEVCDVNLDIVISQSTWLTADGMEYSEEQSELGKIEHHECLYNFFVCFQHLESFRKALAEYEKRLASHKETIKAFRRAVSFNSVFETDVCKSAWLNSKHASNMLAKSVAELNKLINKVGEEK